MSQLKKYILLLIGVLSISLLIGTLINTKKQEQKIIKKNEKQNEQVVTINGRNFETLQTALDTCEESDIVNIHQDLNENIKIKNKCLTIDGRNHTIIGKENSDDMAIMDFENCIVTIRNITIDGESKIDENVPRMGIFLKNSTLYLDDVQVLNLNHEKNKWENYPKGYALYYVNDDNSEQKIYINGCKFMNFHDTAIYINNRSSEKVWVNISENYIEGFPFTICQKAISIKGIVDGSIKENQLIGLTCENKSYGIVTNKKCNISYDNNSFIDVDMKTYNLDD